VAVGELAAGSAHLERPAARVAGVESLLEAWRGRGDITSLRRRPRERLRAAAEPTTADLVGGASTAPV
jgi:hypothetical protein